MSKLTFTCRHCAQPFTPLPNNQAHQQCCHRKLCKRRRRREYQRRWHKARYAEDEAFRAAAKARVKRQRQRTRTPPAAIPASAPDAASAAASDAASAADARLNQVAQAVLGLAAQLGGDADPAQAAALVAAWADCGARLGVGGGPAP